MIRREVPGLLCLLMAISTGALTIPGDEPTAAPGVKVPFSLDDVMSNAYVSDTFNGTWMSDTEIFYRIDELLLKFDVTTQTSQVIAKNAAFDESGLKFHPSPDKNYVLIRNTTKSVYRHSSLSMFSVYNIETK